MAKNSHSLLLERTVTAIKGTLWRLVYPTIDENMQLFVENGDFVSIWNKKDNYHITLSVRTL